MEETLGKAIFALTGTRHVDDDKVDEELSKWLPQLEKALSDPLGNLVISYERAARANESYSLANLEELVDDLREVKDLRNVICHGSWRAPDAEGKSRPFFVGRDGEIFETDIDAEWLRRLREHVTELVLAVVSSVSHMGYQFPGSDGPGRVIFSSSK